jgi:hypothetical protein
MLRHAAVPGLPSDRNTWGRYVRLCGVRGRCRFACACASRGRGAYVSGDPAPLTVFVLFGGAIGWRARLQAQGRDVRT